MNFCYTTQNWAIKSNQILIFIIISVLLLLFAHFYLFRIPRKSNLFWLITLTAIEKSFRRWIFFYRTNLQHASPRSSQNIHLLCIWIFLLLLLCLYCYFKIPVCTLKMYFWLVSDYSSHFSWLLIYDKQSSSDFLGVVEKPSYFTVFFMLNLLVMEASFVEANGNFDIL